MPVSKPVKLPQWAADTAGIATAGATVEPTSGKKVAGFVAGEKPPAQYLNWWQWLVFTWILWLNDIEEQFLQFTLGMKVSGAQTYLGTYAALQAIATTQTNVHAFTATGRGTGAGVIAIGGALGEGVNATGHATANAITATASDGYGLDATGGSAGVRGTGTTSAPGGNFIGGPTNGEGVVGVAGGGNAFGGNFTGSGSGAGVIGAGTGPFAQGGAFVGGGLGWGVQGIGGAGAGGGSFTGALPHGPGAVCTSVGNAPGVQAISDGTLGAYALEVFRSANTDWPAGSILNTSSTQPSLLVSQVGAGPALKVSGGSIEFAGAANQPTPSAGNAGIAGAHKLTELQFARVNVHGTTNGAGGASIDEGVGCSVSVVAGNIRLTFFTAFSNANYIVTEHVQTVGGGSPCIVSQSRVSSSTLDLIISAAGGGGGLPANTTALEFNVTISGRQP